MLIELDLHGERSAGGLTDVVSDPVGLVMLRRSVGLEYARTLTFIANASDVRASELVRGAALAVDDLDQDVRLGVAETCLDYRLLDEVERIVATTRWEDVQDDPGLSNRVLALASKTALRGGRVDDASGVAVRARPRHRDAVRQHPPRHVGHRRDPGQAWQRLLGGEVLQSRDGGGRGVREACRVSRRPPPTQCLAAATDGNQGLFTFVGTPSSAPAFNGVDLA